ncbi:MAG TPA: glycosyltransferase family 9 protein [Chitinophaga sp.]|uniref:glycosyltransferase family 9 protein n=1 Tax=Chitinophaga sp. TaxID=1869181 RepID=UPI002CFD5391|nr:glycosyltransferase family 9 protein [Chitinophaga sp.]HVI48708.1 glycosyltransferase family 9 protein [Chitinophaga sp.]
MKIQDIKSPSLFFVNAIGDAFISLPTIRSLNKTFNGNLAVITNSFLKPLFEEEGLKEIRTINSDIRYDDQNRAMYHFDIPDFKSVLNGTDFFIDINPWHVADNLNEFITLIKSVGINSIGYFDFYAEHISPDYRINSFDNVFRIACHINQQEAIDQYAYPPKVRKNIEEFTRGIRNYFPEDFILLGLHDETKPYKMWQAGKFELLINELQSRYSNLGILILSRSTSIDMENIYDGGRVLYFEDPLSIQVMTGFVSAIDYFIGIDSMFLHLADMYKVPSIGLFGPTNYREWGFRFTEGKEIISPTGKMEDIPLELVLHEMIQLIEKTK